MLYRYTTAHKLKRNMLLLLLLLLLLFVLVSCKNLSVGTLSGVGTHAPVSTQKVEKHGVALHAGAVCLLSVYVCHFSCFGGSFVHTQIGAKLMSCDLDNSTKPNQLNIKVLCKIFM